MTVTSFKNLRTFGIFRINYPQQKGCHCEVKKRVQAEWYDRKRAAGVFCDKKVSAKMKGKLYEVLVRPAMMYGLEAVTITNR